MQTRQSVNATSFDAALKALEDLKNNAESARSNMTRVRALLEDRARSEFLQSIDSITTVYQSRIQQINSQQKEVLGDLQDALGTLKDSQKDWLATTEDSYVPGKLPSVADLSGVTINASGDFAGLGATGKFDHLPEDVKNILLGPSTATGGTAASRAEAARVNEASLAAYVNRQAHEAAAEKEEEEHAARARIAHEQQDMMDRAAERLKAKFEQLPAGFKHSSRRTEVAVKNEVPDDVVEEREQPPPKKKPVRRAREEKTEPVPRKRMALNVSALKRASSTSTTDIDDDFFDL
jgi:hypothetical protein